MNYVVSYRRKVLSSLRWQASAQVIGQLASWLSTIFVIRILAPSDYGVMAMATLFVSFVLLLSDLGIGAAIVQAEKLDKDDLRYIQGFVFLFNAAACVATLVMSGWIAAFFEEPRLVPILAVLSICFVMLALYVLPASRLVRNLDFEKKAKVDISSMVISSGTALVFALTGFGVWSLVAGTLVVHLIRAIGYNLALKSFSLPKLSFSRGSTFLKFGGLIVIDRVLWYLSSNLDVAIAGKFLGKELLGFYAVALMLAAIPLDKLMPVLTQVAFPAVARIQQEPERVRRNLLYALRYANTLFLPVFWGMAWVAADGLPFLLSDKWQSALVPFQLICLVLPLKALASLLSPILFGVGRPIVNVGNMAISLVLLSVGFLIGAQYGLWGLAMSWVIVYPIVFCIVTTRSFAALGMQWSQVAAQLYPSVLAAVGMSGVVYAIQLAMPDYHSGVRLVATIVCGAATYVGVIVMIDRTVVKELRGLLSV